MCNIHPIKCIDRIRILTIIYAFILAQPKPRVIDKLIQVNPRFYLCYYTLDFDPVRIKFKLDIIRWWGSN
jgi:hypothetical protein